MRPRDTAQAPDRAQRAVQGVHRRAGSRLHCRADVHRGGMGDRQRRAGRAGEEYYLDDQIVTTSTLTVMRPDVEKAFPTKVGAGTPHGFTTVVDAGSRAGYHPIRVEALDAKGALTQFATRTVKVALRSRRPRAPTTTTGGGAGGARPAQGAARRAPRHRHAQEAGGLRLQAADQTAPMTTR